MNVKEFTDKIKKLGIETITGIPDSTLQQFCNYIGTTGKDTFPHHIVPENEGAAIGIAIGEYLSTGRPACVYMQNSGLGNIVNPITSLANGEVYGIPMLLLVGWRGEPGVKDEPQHKFMGKITTGLLELLEIPYAVMDKATTPDDLEGYLKKAGECFRQNRQYAIVIKKEAFEKEEMVPYKNGNELVREAAIKEIVTWLDKDDVVVSTTGKISRELYEKLDEVRGTHEQAFLTVGGMGHAKMIAYGIARRRPDKRVICLDGDGAVLMHMGGLAVIGSTPVDNLIHICLDNEAHESVGGMPTGAAGVNYEELAKQCGYQNTYVAATRKELVTALEESRNAKGLAFLRVKVALGSRSDLSRPKESPQENKEAFMNRWSRSS